MIPYRTLGPKEIIYSWENPDVSYSPLRMWAVGRLEQWLTENPKFKLGYAHVDKERADWFIENRGIEQHRIQRLFDNPTWLSKPCIMMRMEPGILSANQKIWDLMLDGHHRYVASAMLGLKYFPLHHLNEADCKPYEVEGAPQPVGRLNVNAFSGLGLD